MLGAFVGAVVAAWKNSPKQGTFVSVLSLSSHISTYYYINNIISCCTHFVYTTWYFRIRVFLRSSGRIIRWNSERDD